VSAVPRRNLIPLALLAALGLAALAFAVLGASSAPSGATLTVQNGSTRTFGTPTGSTSFTMDVVNSVSSADTSGTVSQERLVRFVPPDRMLVYQEVGSTSKLIARLSPSTIPCTLSTYTALVGGPTPWTASGSAFVRTETLQDFAARVPAATATTCAPQPTPVQGKVHETASVREGYLVGVHLTVVVPAQRLANGARTTHGVENQALVMVEINGTRTH
jgi:hypothetical protein